MSYLILLGIYYPYTIQLFKVEVKAADINQTKHFDLILLHAMETIRQIQLCLASYAL